MIKSQKIINRNGVEELSRKIEFYKNYELHRGNKI